MSRTALIIGDSLSGRHAVAEIIQAAPLFRKVLFAGDRKEAWALLKRHGAHMICCDLRPGNRQEVFGLLQSLKGSEEWFDLPVVLFTPEETSESKLKGLELGASDCLPYTIPVKELEVRFRLYLKTKERIDYLRRDQARLARMALTDGLTGIFNRAYFDSVLEQETARYQRTGRPLSILLLDLDHFKKINDTHGHLCGDRTLKVVAKTLQNELRKSDTACRYGGEEFAIVLPETPAKLAYAVAERIRKTIARLTLGFPVTISIGLSCATELKTITSEGMVRQADKALYAAKNGGRNRTAFPEASLPLPSKPFVFDAVAAAANA